MRTFCHGHASAHIRSQHARTHSPVLIIYVSPFDHHLFPFSTFFVCALLRCVQLGFSSIVAFYYLGSPHLAVSTFLGPLYMPTLHSLS